MRGVMVPTALPKNAKFDQYAIRKSVWENGKVKTVCEPPPPFPLRPAGRGATRPPPITSFAARAW